MLNSHPDDDDDDDDVPYYTLGHKPCVSVITRAPYIHTRIHTEELDNERLAWFLNFSDDCIPHTVHTEEKKKIRSG